MTGLVCIHVVPNGIKVDNYICGVGEEMQERNANWVVCSGIFFCNATLCTLPIPTTYLRCKAAFNENQCHAGTAGSCSGSLITVTCFGTKRAS